MDIAKYMTTAILLSTVFTDIKGFWIYTIISIAIVTTLIIGLLLVKEEKEEK